MAIDFPDAPTANQEFTVGDRTWTWTGTRWESLLVANFSATAVSSDINLETNKRYFVDTTTARTLTLPSSPNLGDELVVYDASGQASANNITVLRNGSKINGLLDDALIDIDQSISVFAYTGSTLGWRFE